MVLSITLERPYEAFEQCLADEYTPNEYCYNCNNKHYIPLLTVGTIDYAIVMPFVF